LIQTTKAGLVAFLFGLTSVLAIGGGVQAQPAFPSLSGRVVDQARLLSDTREAEITAKLEALEVDTNDQLAAPGELVRKAKTTVSC
jgi:uncharacterized protein